MTVGVLVRVIVLPMKHDLRHSLLHSNQRLLHPGEFLNNFIKFCVHVAGSLFESRDSVTGCWLGHLHRVFDTRSHPDERVRVHVLSGFVDLRTRNTLHLT